MIKVFVQGEKRSIISKDVQLTNPSGNPLYTGNLVISNNYLNIGALYVFKVTKISDLGIGIDNHFLITSTSYSNSIEHPNSPPFHNGRIKNEYFKSYLVSIPVQLIMTPVNRFSICYSIDFGLMNRITNSGGVYKQFEYVAQLGVSYRLTK